MERWVSYAFGPSGEEDVAQLRRALDYCIGRDVETVVRLVPAIRPRQLRRVCLFLSGLSDKEVAALTGEEVSCIKVTRFRFRRKLAAGGAEGKALAARLSRRRQEETGEGSPGNGKKFKFFPRF